jgi:Cu-Zn family superoxide dismutase
MCVTAIAVFNKENIKGNIIFSQCKNNKYTTIEMNLNSLEPNRTRAIHVHEYGDESNGCKSLGPHWNPYNKNHGCFKKNGNDHHIGDLINNFLTDNKGNFKFIYNDPLIRLIGKYSIIGRSVVIHDGIDDLGLGNNKDSLLKGNAGGRFACAIIGIRK